MQLPSIVVSIGPATSRLPVMRGLIDAGARVARLNGSHQQPAEAARLLTRWRRACADRDRCGTVLLDIPGPKIRFSAEVTPREYRVGSQLVLGKDAYLEGCQPSLHMEPGHRVICGDGAPVFVVERVRGTRVECRCIVAGGLAPRRGAALPDTDLQLPALTEADQRWLKWAAARDVDVIAVSFVRGPEDIEAVRSFAPDKRIIAKIELPIAVSRIEEILDVADGIMVARGDLGVHIGMEYVPVVQKDLIARAVARGKVVIVATQMLESMLTASQPTRAEYTDVANAVLDGASGLMLSGETAVGAYPVEAVAAMARASAVVQDRLWPTSADAPSSDAEAVCRGAVGIAADIGAKALLVPTVSGGSVRACVKYRPSIPLIAAATSPIVAQQLSMEWGVDAFAADGGLAQVREQLIERARQHVRPGEAVVIIHGPEGVSGATSHVEIVHV